MQYYPMVAFQAGPFFDPVFVGTYDIYYTVHFDSYPGKELDYFAEHSQEAFTVTLEDQSEECID